MLMTGGTEIMKLNGCYLEDYRHYQGSINVVSISNYLKTYVMTDKDQLGQIKLGQEELRVRRIRSET